MSLSLHLGYGYTAIADPGNKKPRSVARAGLDRFPD
jgi:hypothetical protein